MIKKSHLCVFVIVLLFSFTGCATTYMPLSKVPNAQELGTIATNFEIDTKVGTGFLAGAAFGAAGLGGLLMGSSFSSIEVLSKDPSSSFNTDQFLVGASIAGVGLAGGLVSTLVFDAPKERKIKNPRRRAAGY